MASSPVIAIGIQARSTSLRFPRKVHEKIGDKSLLHWVWEKAFLASQALPYRTEVHVLVPANDEILKTHVDINPIPGALYDVLSRYVDLKKRTKADFIVRLTADCPLIPASTITKAINIAVITQSDYTSNVFGNLRLDPDGYDCEVLSAKMLEFLDKNAKDIFAREHVTSFLDKGFPAWAQRAFYYSEFLDRSKQKLSVDTKADLARARRHYLMAQRMLEKADK